VRWWVHVALPARPARRRGRAEGRSQRALAFAIPAHPERDAQERGEESDAYSKVLRRLCRAEPGRGDRHRLVHHAASPRRLSPPELPPIGFDELTHFSESQFFYMLSRNRSMCGVRPYVRATTNPDADSWVATFIALVDRPGHGLSVTGTGWRAAMVRPGERHHGLGGLGRGSGRAAFRAAPEVRQRVLDQLNGHIQAGGMPHWHRRTYSRWLRAFREHADDVGMRETLNQAANQVAKDRGARPGN
jgi:hypothetical protein